MLGWLTGGSKIIDSVESVAKEWIETSTEKAEAGKIDAEAKSLFVKVLDPNGKMRKQISRDVTQMYKVYIYLTLFLVLLQSSGIGNQEAIKLAVDSVVELFAPITTLFGIIVTASFGVNGINSLKDK